MFLQIFNRIEIYFLNIQEKNITFTVFNSILVVKINYIHLMKIFNSNIPTKLMWIAILAFQFILTDILLFSVEKENRKKKTLLWQTTYCPITNHLHSRAAWCLVQQKTPHWLAPGLGKTFDNPFDDIVWPSLTLVFPISFLFVVCQGLWREIALL